MTAPRVALLLTAVLLALVTPSANGVGPARTFTVDRTSGAPGTPLTVSGRGWETDAGQVRLHAMSVGGSGAPAVLVGSFEVVDGNFTGIAHVPDVPPGPYELYVCQACEPDPDGISKESHGFRVEAAPRTFVIDPGAARAGDPVAAFGSGWSPGEPVDLRAPEAAGTGLLLTETTAEIDGSFRVIVTVPPLEEGSHRFVACQFCDDVDSEVSLSAAFTVQPVAPQAPTVVVDPPSGRVGSPHVVRGAGWAPDGGPVLVFAGPEDSAFPDRAWVTAAPREDGTITQQFDQPPHVPGPLTLFACQRCTDPAGQAVARTGFRVTVVPLGRPRLVVVPDTVRQHESLTVTGARWIASDEPVLVFADRTGRNRPEEALVRIEPEGGTLPPTPLDADLPIGQHALYACQRCAVAGPLLSATAELTVTPAPAVTPTISVTPSTADGGATVEVTGTGWSVDRGRVSVFADRGDLGDPRLVLVEAAVEAPGVIAAEFEIGDRDAGSYRLFACQDCGSPEGYPSAETTLTVERSGALLPWVVGAILLLLGGAASAVRKALRPAVVPPHPWLRPCPDPDLRPETVTGAGALPTVRLVPHDDRISVLDPREEP
jgi:hypothetical protein